MFKFFKKRHQDQNQASRPKVTPDDLEVRARVGIAAAAELVYQTAHEAGWYHDPETQQPKKRNIGEVIALMHSELSKALEAHRRDAMDDKLPDRSGLEVKFADCIIRILDTSRALGLDVGGALIEKNRFNMNRSDHKLSARAQPGGKKF